MVGKILSGCCELTNKKNFKNACCRDCKARRRYTAFALAGRPEVACLHRAAAHVLLRITSHMSVLSAGCSVFLPAGVSRRTPPPVTHGRVQDQTLWRRRAHNGFEIRESTWHVLDWVYSVRKIDPVS